MYSIKALPCPRYDAPESDPLNWRPDAWQSEFLASKGYRCDCCGLVSRPHKDYLSGYLEIMPADDGNRVLCTMCMQTQHISRPVNGKRNHGLIIYCPSLTQGQIIKMAQWAFMAKYRGNKFAQAANRLISMVVNDLVEPVAQVVPGLATGDIGEFADLYDYMPPHLRDKGPRLFGSLRYWPNEVVFEPQIRFWNVAAFYNITDDL